MTRPIATRPRQVLFLDDSQARHRRFREELGERAVVSGAYTAAEAIEALTDRCFDLVCLDHDLDEEDVMSAVGAATRRPTGMVVVDWLTAAQITPTPTIIVHTMNPPAAVEMVARLIGAGYMTIRAPFGTALFSAKLDAAIEVLS